MAKLERQICLAKQLKYGCILYPLGRFLILPILLGFQLFGQITLPVAVKLGLIPVFAEDTGDVRFVDVIIRNGSPRANGRQQRRDKEDINQCLLHSDAKVGQDFGDLPERRKKVCAMAKSLRFVPAYPVHTMRIGFLSSSSATNVNVP